MPYYLIERQSGGCDYTIGCGIRIIQLTAKSKEEAMQQADDEIGNAWRGEHENCIDNAELLEVAESIDLTDFLNAKKSERAERKRIKNEADQHQQDEEEFERLRQRLGK